MPKLISGEIRLCEPHSAIKAHGMMKEARRLREKAIDSLVLSIEHFNRPWDRGRTDAVLIRRVNELDFYSVGAAQLAEKVGLTQPKSRAVVDHLGLREDANYFKEIRSVA